ncbi:MAG: hypothetical protein DDT36_01630 [Firmicutes bacterium]|nr:hypothetical protein [Bacillota bacterium]
MLVNQRLLMNYRLAFSSLFLGVLAAFMVWSFQWALESRKAVTLDMPGDVTVLRVSEGPIVRADDAASAQEELKAYIYDRSLSLIISSYGDGRPEMLVYDPHGVLSWFPRASSENLQSASSAVYLFKGTFSERRWSESGTTPLLPKGVVPEGVIAAPRGAGNHQYARRITWDPLLSGIYTINTNDPTQVRHILDLLHRMGLTERGLQTLPLVMYLTLNPLFIVTVLFLVLGYVCAVLYWALYLRGRAHEFGVRSRCGARPAELIWENVVGGLPGLVTGSVAGVILSGLLVAAIGHVPLTPSNFQTLADSVIVAVVAATIAWSTVLYIVVRSRYEVNLNG